MNKKSGEEVALALRAAITSQEQERPEAQFAGQDLCPVRSQPPRLFWGRASQSETPHVATSKTNSWAFKRLDLLKLPGLPVFGRTPHGFCALRRMNHCRTL